MAVAIVQRSAYGNGGGGANGPRAFGANATVGNTIVIVIFVAIYVADPTSVTDNLGNTYVKDVSLAAVGAGSVDRFMVYRTSNLANTPASVTVTVAQATKIVAYEVSGLSNTSPLDVNTVGTAAGSTAPSYPFTSTTAGEFAVGMLSISNGGAGQTFTAGTGWTLDSTAAAEIVWFESKVLGAAGSYNLDGTLSASSGLWDFCAITYKAPAVASTWPKGWMRYLQTTGVLAAAAWVAAAVWDAVYGPY